MCIRETLRESFMEIESLDFNYSPTIVYDITYLSTLFESKLYLLHKDT